MKKMVMLFLIILTMSGCENNKNKYEDFEHYDLKNFKIINLNTFYSDKGAETYVVADISPEKGVEGREHGIFYKVDQNDYILLDTINVCEQYQDLQNQDQYTYFYSDEKTGEKKLFMIRCIGGLLLEYDFQEEQFEKKDLKFDTTAISSEPLEYVQFSSIQKVETDNIYYKGNIHNLGEYNLVIKCSLSTNKCELVE